MPLAVEEIENIEPETLKKREKGYNQFINFMSNYWDLHWLSHYSRDSS